MARPVSKDPMVPLNARVPASVLAAVSEQARKEGLSLGEWVRAALDLKLQEKAIDRGLVRVGVIPVPRAALGRPTFTTELSGARDRGVISVGPPTKPVAMNPRRPAKTVPEYRPLDRTRMPDPRVCLSCGIQRLYHYGQPLRCENTRCPEVGK